MARLNSDVLLKVENSIPVELKQEALNGWSILWSNLPFLLTVTIVLGSAIVTYKVQMKGKKAEHENKISEFRHHWLQELRETASELIKTMHLCQLHYMRRAIVLDFKRSAETNFHTSNRIKGTTEQINSLMEQSKTHYENFLEARSNFYGLEAKLKMFFKNGDDASKDLFTLLDNFKNEMQKDRHCLDDAPLNSAVAELQKILKDEWEVTKKRSWLNSQQNN
ncbi:hypothetical protein [Pseudoalteromonas sp. MEBiC 03485]|uniref:hypothetical protein n=1 Tax=Pseudoalteromonas sp. MEBiC 03485 TaxID=2571103 RepID=UPI001020FE4D|nr:hypothetical protein [Pseudoalteromonas sp. MEBiC 03485]RZD19741.1 hypothetical protein EVU92_21295 [Pseudoalteromonas sp. MEBiC 03485]